MKWGVFDRVEKDKTVHVAPICDELGVVLEGHVMLPTCSCRPTLTGIRDALLVVHHEH